ncbi:oligosaccharide repeat unit polymerase [Aeromonas sp. R7-5]|uniref:oligosaccharide repeat unit polymerase n=1 Tax=Aeromonas sp. R7-5 TaxID=3138477 RepID=UPI0034A1B3FE
MRINITLLLFLFYFLANFYGFISFFIQNELGGDFKGWPISDTVEYFFSGVLELSLMVGFYCLISLLSKERKESYNFSCGDKIAGRLLFFVLILQVVYFYYSISTGVGSLSYEGPTVDVGVVKYFFTLFNPDAITLLSLFICDKNNKKLKSINIGLFVLSNLYRGWVAGALMSLFVIFLSRQQSIKIKLPKFFIILCVFLAISPSIYYVKYVSRGAENISIESYTKYYSFETYKEVLSSIASRFQHISEVYVLFTHRDELRNAFDNGSFVPMVFDNHIRRQLSSWFSIEYQTVGEYAAKYILQRPSGGNIHVGILTWFYFGFHLLFIYILSFVFYVKFFHYFCSRLVPHHTAKTMLVWFWLLFFMHGWFSSISIYILSVMEIYFFMHFFGTKEDKIER